MSRNSGLMGAMYLLMAQTADLPDGVQRLDDGDGHTLIAAWSGGGPRAAGGEDEERVRRRPPPRGDVPDPEPEPVPRSPSLKCVADIIRTLFEVMPRRLTTPKLVEEMAARGREHSQRAVEDYASGLRKSGAIANDNDGKGYYIPE